MRPRPLPDSYGAHREFWLLEEQIAISHYGRILGMMDDEIYGMVMSYGRQTW